MSNPHPPIATTPLTEHAAAHKKPHRRERRVGSSGFWSTNNEIDFIRNLGTHSDPGLQTERETLLAGYRMGAEKRRDWGNLDKDEILDELDVLQGMRLRRAKWRKCK